MQFEKFQPKANGPLSKHAASEILFMKNKHGTWKNLTENIPITSVQPVTLNNLVSACLDNSTKQPTRNVSTKTAKELYKELFPNGKLENFPLVTKELINDYQIQNINKICASVGFYYSLASKLETESKKTNNEAIKQMYSMLSQVFYVMLSFKDPKDPYDPMAIMFNTQTMIFADLTKKNLKFLSYINSKIRNSLFNSRINDLLWLRKYKEGENSSYHLHAESAFNNFCEIAKMIFQKGFEHENYFYGKGYLERAAQLWKQLNLQDKYEKLTEIALLGMHLDKPEPENYLRFLVVEIVVEFELFKDLKILKNKMISLAKESLTSKDFRKAKDYLDLLIKLLKKSNDTNEVNKYKEEIGDIMTEEAYYIASKGGALVAVKFYLDAIEYNKNLKNRKELVDKLEKKLHQMQTKAISEMKEVTFSVPLPMEELLEDGRRAITGKYHEEAIKNIASMILPEKLSDIKKLARDSMSKSFVLSRIPVTLFDDRGKIISRKGDKGEIFETNVKAEMIRLISTKINWFSFTKIEEARKILYKTESSNEKIFRHLVEENSFVPRGREKLFEEGLKYGLKGNWLCCSHILIPQLENSIRTVMEKFGVATKKTKTDQTQKELDLNYLLNGESQTEAEKIWGKDFIFELKILLTEKSGINFRNKVCHGFIDADTFSDPCPNVYLWATTLHLLHWGKELNKNIRKFVKVNQQKKE